jgi:GNAT superfamily N-acetyltransferase
MKVRLAEMKDVDATMRLGVQMHAESRFRVYPMNVAKTRASMELIIANPLASCILLAEHAEHGVVGMLAGYVVDYFFSNALVAQDSYFFVHPQYRGSPAALKLLIAFRRWAENRSASELCINMSVDVQQERFNKFMHHMQFKPCGSNFVLPLKIVPVPRSAVQRPGANAETIPSP